MKVNELTKFAITLFLLPWIPAFILYKYSFVKAAVIVIGVFIALSAASFIFKKFAKLLKNILDEIGKFLGKYLAIAALAVVYICAVIPTGLLMKIVKRDRLRLKKPDIKTYWVDNEVQKTDYEYQF